MIKEPEKRDGERKPFNSQVHFRLSAINLKEKHMFSMWDVGWT